MNPNRASVNTRALRFIDVSHCNLNVAGAHHLTAAARSLSEPFRADILAPQNLVKNVLPAQTRHSFRRGYCCTPCLVPLLNYLAATPRYPPAGTAVLRSLFLTRGRTSTSSRFGDNVGLRPPVVKIDFMSSLKSVDRQTDTTFLPCENLQHKRVFAVRSLHNHFQTAHVWQHNTCCCSLGSSIYLDTTTGDTARESHKTHTPRKAETRKQKNGRSR